MNVSIRWRKDMRPHGSLFPPHHYYERPDSKPELDILISDEQGFRLVTIPYREAISGLFEDMQ